MGTNFWKPLLLLGNIRLWREVALSMSVSNETLLELVGLIYDSAIDSNHWPRFLKSFSDAVGGSVAGFLSQQHTKSGLVAGGEFVGMDPHFFRLYRERFSKVDEWVHAAQLAGKAGSGSVTISDEAVRLDRLKRTEFFNDYLKPQDTVHQFGGVIELNAQVFSGITCLRGATAGPFGEPEVKLLETVLPHLERAMQMGRQTAAIGKMCLEALNSLANGVIVLDVGGKLLFVNEAGEELLRHADGLLKAPDGLQANSSAETRELRNAIEVAGRDPAKQGIRSGKKLFLSRRSGSPALSVMVMPLSQHAFSLGRSTPAALVLVNDGAKAVRCGTVELTEQCGLTAAEAKLAALLGNGEALTEAARTLGVSHNTVRSQLRSIFDKTGVSHQNALVRMIWSMGVLR